MIFLRRVPSGEHMNPSEVEQWASERLLDRADIITTINGGGTQPVSPLSLPKGIAA